MEQMHSSGVRHFVVVPSYNGRVGRDKETLSTTVPYMVKYSRITAEPCRTRSTLRSPSNYRDDTLIRLHDRSGPYTERFHGNWSSSMSTMTTLYTKEMIGGL